MGRRVKIHPHLNNDNLEALYRETKDPIKRSHYQIIWLLSKGHKIREVAEVTGYSQDWIGKLAKRYNQHGPDSLGDKRHDHPGGKTILTQEQQQQLRAALLKPHPSEGLWNSRLVAEWVFEKTGRRVHPQRGWEYLKRLGFSRQKPRPRHEQASGEKQEAFKKSSSWSPS